MDNGSSIESGSGKPVTVESVKEVLGIKETGVEGDQKLSAALDKVLQERNDLVDEIAQKNQYEDVHKLREVLGDMRDTASKSAEYAQKMDGNDNAENVDTPEKIKGKGKAKEGSEKVEGKGIIQRIKAHVERNRGKYVFLAALIAAGFGLNMLRNANRDIARETSTMMQEINTGTNALTPPIRLTKPGSVPGMGAGPQFGIDLPEGTIDPGR